MANDNVPKSQPDDNSPRAVGASPEKISSSPSNTPSESQISDEETEVVEAFKELPPDQKQIMTSIIAMREMSSPSSSVVAKRVTSEHITQTIGNLDKENEREFKRSQAGEVTKRLGMGAILALVLMVFGYAGLTKDKDLAEKVIIAGISGLGGFGAGVALSKKKP